MPGWSDLTGGSYYNGSAATMGRNWPTRLKRNGPSRYFALLGVIAGDGGC
jgi:hypothetical protein